MLGMVGLGLDLVGWPDDGKSKTVKLWFMTSLTDGDKTCGL